MPRIVNCPTSDYSSEDDDKTDKSNWQNSNSRPAFHRITAQRERYTNSNYSHNSMPIVNFKEDDIYCITRVIGGKVKKYKKDSRTWLHKSSEKARAKGKIIAATWPTQKSVKDVTKSSSDIINGNVNCSDSDIVATSGPKCVRFQNEATCVVEFPNEWEVGGNSNRSVRVEQNDVEMEDEYEYIGDSDADLTYSEEESPVKASSYVEIWRQKGQTDISPSKSVDSMHTCANTNVRSTESCDSMASNRSICENASSFEHLDLCNESGNSIRSVPTRMDISRKLAPAIEIERESYLENVLDYAVNKQASDRVKQYCEEIYRRTRNRPKAHGESPCSTEGSSKQGRPRTRHVVRNIESQMGESIANRVGKRHPVRKPLAKRVRRNSVEEKSQDLLQTNENTTETTLSNAEADIASAEMTSHHCRYDEIVHNTPPSLFIIAGYVLYGLLQSRSGRQTD